MSHVFNDTDRLSGLVQIYEREIGAEYGDVSGNTARLKEFTSDANSAFDEFVLLAFQSQGTWRYDDSNQTDYPIITGDLVSGQRDYPLVADETGNLILEVVQVEVASPSGVFSKISPIDVPGDDNSSSFYDGQNTSGTPTRYGKLGNGVFLDPVPNYALAAGIKLYVSREPSYFTYTDTTKKPGVPGTLHKWFAIRPAEEYARRDALANYQAIVGERLRLEENIKTYFSARNRDEKPRFTITRENNR